MHVHLCRQPSENVITKAHVLASARHARHYFETYLQERDTQVITSRLTCKSEASMTFTHLQAALQEGHKGTVVASDCRCYILAPWPALLPPRICDDARSTARIEEHLLA